MQHLCQCVGESISVASPHCEEKAPANVLLVNISILISKDKYWNKYKQYNRV